MDIKNFKTFKKVAELGSFTGAAQELGYAQSTITFQIQAIEDYYNKPLFNRMGKAIEITQFGQELLGHIGSLLNTYEVIEKYTMAENKPKGVIKIGAPESLMMYRLLQIVKAYKAIYPEVELTIINDQCCHLREKLSTGDLDVSFLVQPQYIYSQLETIQLKKEEMCLVAAADYKGDDFLPNSGQMVLFTEKECTYREVFNNYLQGHQFYPTNILETGSVEAIKKYVEAGLGMSYLPLYAVTEEEDKKKFKIKKLESNIAFYTQIVYHKNKWLNPALKAFIELSLSQAAAWL
jgi:DNA-binding transcriptional LysR family regulator